MNITNKHIDMVAVFNKAGEPKPIRFRITDENGEHQVYKIEKIMAKGIQKIEKQNIWIFNCLIVMSGFQRLCELRYNMVETRWVLYKI